MRFTTLPTRLVLVVLTARRLIASISSKQQCKQCVKPFCKFVRSPITCLWMAHTSLKSPYLPKPFRLEDFISQVLDASREPVTGKLPIPDLRAEVLRRLADYSVRHQLTAREQQVARLAVEGVPRARFSLELGVSENTCKTLVRRVLAKCDARRLADIPRRLLAGDDGELP